MACCDTKESYGGVTRFFHWLIFLLITVQLLLGLLMGDIANNLWHARAHTIHKSLGLVTLLFAVLFIFWRWFNPRPGWPQSMPRWEKIIADAVHTVLHWLIVLMPLSGWLMSTAANKPPSFFWLFTVSLPLVPHNSALASTAAVLHLVLAWAITVFAVLHVLAAAKHYFIDKDRILQRMLKG